jgi:RimJ/RimL family protein N-acetyltransferase
VGSRALSTKRLELLPPTPELVRAELTDRFRFSRMLDAIVPTSWPPPLNDGADPERALELLDASPCDAGFTRWYVLLHAPNGRKIAIGCAAFKGPPGHDRKVEIAISVLPEHQKAGYATEAVAALLAWAFEDGSVEIVAAETFPHLIGSVRVLEKTGFRHVGHGRHPGSVRLELARSRYRGR